MTQGPELALVFDLEGERFALPAADVVKVVELGPLSALPLLPPAIRGISHHRGRIVTVVDLAVLVLDRKHRNEQLNPAGRLVLVERGGRNVGLLTGPVDEIVPLDPATGSPPPREGTLVARIHLHKGRALGVLSTEQLLIRITRLCNPETARRPHLGAASAGA